MICCGSFSKHWSHSYCFAALFVFVSLLSNGSFLIVYFLLYQFLYAIKTYSEIVAPGQQNLKQNEIILSEESMKFTKQTAHSCQNNGQKLRRQALRSNEEVNLCDEGLYERPSCRNSRSADIVRNWTLSADRGEYSSTTLDRFLYEHLGFRIHYCKLSTNLRWKRRRRVCAVFYFRFSVPLRHRFR